MINCMKYWITNSDIDGFRCDVAGNVPDDFWKKCIPQLKKTMKNIFMLAEADKASLQLMVLMPLIHGECFHMMNKVAKGERSAFALDSIRNYVDTNFSAECYCKCILPAIMMRIAGIRLIMELCRGRLMHLLPCSHKLCRMIVPLIYSGQEEPVLDSISFFYKDTIQFKNFGRAKFYKTLLELRKNPALAANASFKKVNVGDDKAIYAYTREGSGKKILVILNLSKKEQPVRITDAELIGQSL